MANKNVKDSCRFAKRSWEKDVCNGCIALKDMHCKNDGKCAFYKPKTSEYGNCEQCEYYVYDAHEKMSICRNTTGSLYNLGITADCGCNQFQKRIPRGEN